MKLLLIAQLVYEVPDDTYDLELENQEALNRLYEELGVGAPIATEIKEIY